MIPKSLPMPPAASFPAPPPLPAGAAVAFGFIAWGGVILPPPPPGSGAGAGDAPRRDEGLAAWTGAPRGELPARRSRKDLRGLFINVWA